MSRNTGQGKIILYMLGISLEILYDIKSYIQTIDKFSHQKHKTNFIVVNLQPLTNG